MKSVMRDGVRADQEFEPKHAPGKILQGKRGHSFASLGLNLRPNALRNAKKKGAGSGCRIEDRDQRIAQSLGCEIGAKRAVERADHVKNDRERRVIDAISLAGLGIERR